MGEKQSQSKPDFGVCRASARSWSYAAQGLERARDNPRLTYRHYGEKAAIRVCRQILRATRTVVISTGDPKLALSEVEWGRNGEISLRRGAGAVSGLPAIPGRPGPARTGGLPEITRRAHSAGDFSTPLRSGRNDNTRYLPLAINPPSNADRTPAQSLGQKAVAIIWVMPIMRDCQNQVSTLRGQKETLLGDDTHGASGRVGD